MARYDPLTKAERSERMSRVKAKHTNPELFVRKLVHRLGYRFRLHVSALPGKPDLVFRKLNKVIFVHGCFWHLHGCNYYRMPKTRRGFWLPKLRYNALRDKKNYLFLKKLGFKALIIWECELLKRNTGKLERKISKFLGEKR